MATLLPAAQDIFATVDEEIALLGGTVSDAFDRGGRLFLRALLPMTDEVRPGDSVDGGIAVRVVEQTIEVCPYLFREVCRNGAIMPHVTEVQHVRRVGFAAPSEAIEAVDEELREAVRACAAPEAFAKAARQVRSAAATELLSEMVQLLLFSSQQRAISADLREEIMHRFLGAADHSVFGLMNAVTSVARDQEDPDARWRLEELGGGVPAMRLPQVQPGGAAALATAAV
jgi:hypothetical protein